MAKLIGHRLHRCIVTYFGNRLDGLEVWEVFLAADLRNLWELNSNFIDRYEVSHSSG